MTTQIKKDAPAPHSESTPKRRFVWPSITVDLRRPKHRYKVSVGFFSLGMVVVAMLFVGSKGFHYSESSEFCGKLCHSMESLFIRYEASPHAKVECAECHIGPGTSHFIRAKLDGIRSLYYTISDTYERPIKSPVHNLRPARETCEECHTPNSFTDNVIKTIVRYDNDEANSLIQTTIILKMGGWRESTGMSEGIHWHITNPVYYVAADEQRQVIMWIGAERKDGTLKEYYARDILGMAQTSFMEKAQAEGTVRTMDCIDCHNRSGHLIPPPNVVVDNAISDDLIAQDLPYIRARAVELLGAVYNSEAEAHAAIDGLLDFYRTNYPQTFDSRQPELYQAVKELKDLYSSTTFPDMELNWQTNPNNEVHTPFLGCFRCHDGKHVLADPEEGETDVISVKCNLCHTVPIVGRGSDIVFEAPVIVGDVPASHSDFRYTVEHRTTTEAQRQECYQCHGQGFCQNKACHSLQHPPDMLYTHPDEYRRTGDQVCYTCHQAILCSRCHPGGVISSP